MRREKGSYSSVTRRMVCYTLFKQEETQLMTCESGGHISQINFLVMGQVDRRLVTSMVRNVKVFVGEEGLTSSSCLRIHDSG